VHSIDTTLLLVRLIVGLTMALHGWNHAFGGGKIAGTAAWFDSLGLRPGHVHALMSVVAEIGCGLALAAGFLTPLAAGGLLGTMVVAGIIEHRTHGFFVFRGGYEYVLMIAVVVTAVAVSGGGRASVDHAMGFRLGATAGFLTCLAIGVGGAAILLSLCWRPRAAEHPKSEQSDSEQGDSEPAEMLATTKGDQ
jgi:putative oxidoreductase